MEKVAEALATARTAVEATEDDPRPRTMQRALSALLVAVEAVAEGPTEDDDDDDEEEDEDPDEKDDDDEVA
jgi:hypothetical protein